MPTFPTLKLGSHSPYVKKLKMDLNGLSKNYNNFVINDIYDLKIEDVVKNFQDSVKLPRDGIVGPATWTYLIEKVKKIQEKLNSRGYQTGNPDGWLGVTTINAVKRFQRDNGLH
ncbi:MAG: peptidoglycan-binding protein, partial [Desulfosporosinus sp.]|nr:peptidoglycan-binding protein [Desulfosporosinus sp.]